MAVLPATAAVAEHRAGSPPAGLVAATRHALLIAMIGRAVLHASVGIACLATRDDPFATLHAAFVEAILMALQVATRRAAMIRRLTIQLAAVLITPAVGIPVYITGDAAVRIGVSLSVGISVAQSAAVVDWLRRVRAARRVHEDKPGQGESKLAHQEPHGTSF